MLFHGPELLWLLPAFFLVALVYAAAGFGGGSSYLALLALAGLPPGGIRPLALACNLAVTGTGSLAYARAGRIPWRRALPLVAASMPAAFLGGRVNLPRDQYLLLLGGLLVGAALLMLLQRRPAGEEGTGRTAYVPPLAVLAGAGVGFLAGVVGIGGGIFLSPLLFLTRWDTPRRIAATTSLFIALNSLAGLLGQWSVGLTFELYGTLAPLAAVLGGGYLGTHLTLRRLRPATIRKIAAVLILIVGARLCYTYWPF